MAVDRIFEQGRWWQWDGGQWLLEPHALPPLSEDASEDWDGDQSDPEYLELLVEERARYTRVSNLRRVSLLVVLLAVGLIVAATAFRPSRGEVEAAQTLRKAYTGCGLGPGASIDSASNRLTLDTGAGASIGQIGCIEIYLHMPTSVAANIESTRALDGTQSDVWTGFRATWRYGANTGLFLTIEET